MSSDQTSFIGGTELLATKLDPFTCVDCRLHSRNSVRLDFTDKKPRCYWCSRKKGTPDVPGSVLHRASNRGGKL